MQDAVYKLDPLQTIGRVFCPVPREGQALSPKLSFAELPLPECADLECWRWQPCVACNRVVAAGRIVGGEDGYVWPGVSLRLEAANLLKEHPESVACMLVRTTLTDPTEGRIKFIGGPRVIGWETRTFERTHGAKHETLRITRPILVGNQPARKRSEVLDVG